MDCTIAEELLLAGWSMALLDPQKPTEEIGEETLHIPANVDGLQDKASEVKAFNPECVIHLSARSSDDIDALCELCEGQASHFVVASSFNVYKACALVYETEMEDLDNTPISESSLLRDGPLLGDSENDRLDLEKRLAKCKVPTTILRLPPVYGPGDSLYRLLPLIARMLDERPFIPVPETQANWKWTHGYSEDIAHGIALAALKSTESNRVYNIGETKAPTIYERITHLATVIGWTGGVAVLPDSELPSHVVPKGNFDQNLELDSSKIRSELGYKEKVDYYDGLYEAIEWYRGNLPAKYKETEFDYESEDALKSIVEEVLRSK